MSSSDSTPLKGYETVTNLSDSEATLPKRTITILGAVRVLLGAATLLAPTTTGKLFFIPITGNSIPLARYFGIREIVLGELLLTADNGGKDRREVKRALTAGAAADAVDIGITVFAFAQGQMSKMGAGLFGGGAASLVFLGLYGLKNLQ